MNLKKIGKVFTGKYVGTGPSSYKKRIYRAAVSQRLRNTGLKLFYQPTLMHNFYSLTICLLHYYPRHVSSINMPILRRKNCIHTASGIFALCKRPPSTLVESGCALTFRRRNFLLNFSTPCF